MIFLLILVPQATALLYFSRSPLHGYLHQYALIASTLLFVAKCVLLTGFLGKFFLQKYHIQRVNIFVQRNGLTLPNCQKNFTTKLYILMTAWCYLGIYLSFECYRLYLNQIILLYQYGIGSEEEDRMNPDKGLFKLFSWIEFVTIPILLVILLNLNGLFHKLNKKIRITMNKWYSSKQKCRLFLFS